MEVFCLHICQCTIFTPGDKGDQEGVSNRLGLELQMVLSHCVVARTQTWVLWKGSHFSSSHFQLHVLEERVLSWCGSFILSPQDRMKYANTLCTGLQRGSLVCSVDLHVLILTRYILADML